MPGLFFADDLGILATREQGITKQLQITYDFVQERQLTVNYNKSAIVEVGAKKGKVLNGGWQIGEDGVIPATDEYKYLGVWQNRRGRYRAHFTKMAKGARSRTAAAIMLARGSGQMAEGIHKMWTGVMTPTLLYGTEAIPVTKKWVQIVEGVQSEMGRKVIGATGDASRAGIRGELGWASVQGLIYRGKCMFFEQIKRMGGNRWPKRIIEELEAGTFNSQWWEELKRAQEELNIIGGVQSGEKWKGVIHKKFWAYEEKKWRAEVEERGSLKWYPKEQLKGAIQMRPEARRRKLFSRIRIGNILPIGIKQKLEGCPWCQDKPEDWGTHIMLGCPGGGDMLQGGTQGWGKEQIDKRMRETLADLGNANIRKVTSKVEGWMTKIDR